MGRRGTTEGPLVVWGQNPVLELLQSEQGVERVLLASVATRAAAIGEAARRRGVPVAHETRENLDRLARGNAHQGVVAMAAPFVHVPFDALAGPERGSVLVLDGIQDPRNLGAILRTARAAGVTGVVLPRDRSSPVTPVVVAASAGTLFGLRIARVPNLVRAMQGLKDAGFWLIGLVPGAARTVFELDVPEKPALVAGSEAEGLRQLVRRTCDFEASIPMAPGVESLNVSVAVGVALYEIRRRRPGG